LGRLEGCDDGEGKREGEFFCASFSAIQPVCSRQFVETVLLSFIVPSIEPKRRLQRERMSFKARPVALLLPLHALGYFSILLPTHTDRTSSLDRCIVAQFSRWPLSLFSVALVEPFSEYERRVVRQIEAGGDEHRRLEIAYVLSLLPCRRTNRSLARKRRQTDRTSLINLPSAAEGQRACPSSSADSFRGAKPAFSQQGRVGG
jgi:hypothetical protein